MSSTESIKENTFVLSHYLFSSNNTTHRETVAHAFSHGNNVRLITSPSVSPEFLSNSSKTCLNLIGNYNTTIFFDKLSHSWTVTCWYWVNSSDALNRFEYHSCNFAMNCVWLKSLLSISDQIFSSFNYSSVLAWPG